MQCSYFDAGLCRSCTLLDRPRSDQLVEKEERVRALLAPHVEGQDAPVAWLPTMAGPEEGFRNKAKMVVGGTIDDPTLGILDGQGRGVDLQGCGLHLPGIQDVLPDLAEFVTRARLLPYDVPKRRGEAKYVHVTEAPSGELMVRFVLRTDHLLPRLRAELPYLLEALPQIAVVTVNLLPDHVALLEGEHEIVLTDRDTLPLQLGDVELHLRPQSFFQTNTAIAAGLYAQAAEWVDEIDPATVWDLYCGIGGFALHVASPSREVVGIETSAEAVASARTSAREAGHENVTFATADATEFATTAAAPPGVVVVNPPRRGIGAPLAGWLETSGVEHVVYSSCNPVTLASDLAAMPSFEVRQVRVFDMFPQTTHLEVMVLLRRR